jgi:hypothetical protein
VIFRSYVEGAIPGDPAAASATGAMPPGMAPPAGP